MKSQWFSNIKVEDVVSPSFYTVPSTLTIEEVFTKMNKENVEDILVTDEEGKFLGLTTRKHLELVFAQSRIDCSGMTVDKAMITQPIATFPQEDLNDARRKMRRAKVGRLPVVDEDKTPRGILTAVEVCTAFSAKLEAMGKQMETIFNTIDEAIILIDDEQRVLYWNTGAEKIYEIRQEDVTGKLIGEVIANSFVLKVLKTGKPVYHEYEITPSGRHLLKSGIPYYQYPGRLWVVCTAQDVTRFVNILGELNQTRDKISALEKKSNSDEANMDLFVRTKSKAFHEVLETARLLSRTDSTVLILGESGTGKELMSSTIHSLSNRRDKPFVVINCAAIPESLFESELFGYTKGAFTGASKEGMPGKFELANGGTLFLDEIGELSFDMQAKLLRVLQEKTFYRIGGITPVNANTRIIAATNKDLWKMVQESKFREDLFYRLNVFNLKMPALRQRQEDIPPLIEYYIDQFAKKYNLGAPEISPGAMRFLMDYEWRGNIRELKNFVERIVVFSQNEIVSREQVIKIIQGDSQIETAAVPGEAAAGESGGLSDILESKEREIISDLLKKYNNNKSDVAKALNIPRSTLYYRMKSLGIAD
ncbi:Anaerobic nitric oxide reductase transcription regulator NorR [bioreactor metagenome]|uniref:Anaerobic nitric oxide reductase transcription regulator NorR n=1 Tax=bioreactor metagenome TaxID=1076179 RepID=A0A644W758_9ZZZZ